MSKNRTRLAATMAAAMMMVAGLACGAAGTTYSSCAEARKAGKAPLHKGDEGYSSKLDRDGDGVACS